VDWLTVWQYREAILGGLTLTIWLSAAAIVGSTFVGVTVGCLGTTPSFVIPRLTRAYIEFLRNIPIVVKVFFFYFIVGLPGIPAALIALVLHQSAYIADVTGAGIRSIARGQLDAGLSLGHGYWQVFRYVIVPQMVRVIIPPLTTQYVSVIKNTSVVALIAVQDLTFETQEVNVATFRGFEAATVATVLYIAVAMVVIALMTALHSRIGVR
jgi:His/Glu/Gln/Arg/opine family amino acid ABC transporter permease subunit